VRDTSRKGDKEGALASLRRASGTAEADMKYRQKQYPGNHDKGINSIKITSTSVKENKQ